jgi:hypothetical protein
MQASRQFSFRLPTGLVQRVEDCADAMRDQGLDLTRADVVRLLLNFALDSTHCQMHLLLQKPGNRRPKP